MVPNLMQQWGGGSFPAMGYAGMLGLPQGQLPLVPGGGAGGESMTAGWSYPPLPPNLAAREPRLPSQDHTALRL